MILKIKNLMNSIAGKESIAESTAFSQLGAKLRANKTKAEVKSLLKTIDKGENIRAHST